MKLHRKSGSFLGYSQPGLSKLAFWSVIDRELERKVWASVGGPRCADSVHPPPLVECCGIPLKPKNGLNGAPSLCCSYIGNSRLSGHGSFHTHSLYEQQKVGAPLPRFPAEACGVDRLHAPFLMKGAHAELSSTAWQEIGVKPFFCLSGIPQHSTSGGGWTKSAQRQPTRFFCPRSLQRIQQVAPSSSPFVRSFGQL
jgi:hypothetical protein